jgi:hypothetical protein
MVSGVFIATVVLGLTFSCQIAHREANAASAKKNGNGVENAASPGSCRNVVVLGSVAYAACGDVIKYVDTKFPQLLTRDIPVSHRADDIAIGDGLIFTVSAYQDHVVSFSVDQNYVDVYQPDAQTGLKLLGSVPAPGQFFNGISARGGMVVVSGGRNDAMIARYQVSPFQITVLQEKLRLPVDSEKSRYFGRPDVTLLSTPTGFGVLAFFPIDVNFMGDWGLHIAEIDSQGAVTDRDFQELKSKLPVFELIDFLNTYSPTNYPASIVQLPGGKPEQFFMSYWASKSLIELRTDSTAQKWRRGQEIKLDFVPINLTSAESSLYCVGNKQSAEHKITKIMFHNTEADTYTRSEINLPNASRPVGLVKVSKYLVVADLDTGLLILEE